MSFLEIPQRNVKELWCDYLFLTREMGKAISRHDFMLFEDILAQREVLQRLIDATQDKQFPQTEDGRELLRQVIEENRAMHQEFQFYATAIKNKVTVAKAYEEVSTGTVGRRMDHQG